MQWFTARTSENKNYERKKWHLWFAWRPVTVDTYQPEGVKKVAWLEWVWRCGELSCGWDSCNWFYIYSSTKPKHHNKETLEDDIPTEGALK